jgi:outer membrane immunogenic protein
MKKLIVAGIAAVAFCNAPALAADMAVKAPPPAPVAAPYSWTGFYIGGFAGGAGASNATTTDPCAIGSGLCSPTSPATFDGVGPANYRINTGFTGGGVVGYNLQVNPNIVVGLEDKLGYFHLHGSASFNDPGFPGISAFTTYGDWYDAYMGRIGATFGHTMLFLEGGGVTARIQTGYVNTVTPVTLNITSATTETSWAAGGGLEYALDNHWSLEGEVLALGLRNPINGCGTASDATAWCNQSKPGGVTVVDVGVDYAFK